MLQKQQNDPTPPWRTGRTRQCVALIRSPMSHGGDLAVPAGTPRRHCPPQFRPTRARDGGPMCHTSPRTFQGPSPIHHSHYIKGKGAPEGSKIPRSLRPGLLFLHPPRFPPLGRPRSGGHRTPQTINSTNRRRCPRVGENTPHHIGQTTSLGCTLVGGGGTIVTRPVHSPVFFPSTGPPFPTTTSLPARRPTSPSGCRSERTRSKTTIPTRPLLTEGATTPSPAIIGHHSPPGGSPSSLHHCTLTLRCRRTTLLFRRPIAHRQNPAPNLNRPSPRQ